MKEPPIEGKIAATLPALESVPPSTAQSYESAGRNLMNGFEGLVNGHPKVLWAASFLAAQSTECFLKAFLAAKSVEEKELRHKSVRHNLEELWRLAESNGLGIASSPPGWVSHLNSAHDSPYYFRYPMKLNGMSFPNQEQLRVGLRELLSAVEKAT